MRRARAAPLLAVALAAAMLPGYAREPDAPVNLVLVSLDTTPPDHLSAYGYPRETSPHFDRLAEGGALFHNAFAQWTATGPSHATMLTGLYPHTHGFGVTRPRLRRRFGSLASILREQGYRTGAFVSGFTLSGRLGRGLGRGFDVYDDAFVGTRRNGALTLAAALDWLAAGEGPYFLFFHLFDAHGPYTAEGEYPRRFFAEHRGPEMDRVPHPQRIWDESGQLFRHVNDYVDHYDSGLLYQDEILGGLLEVVDLDSTVVMVVADHGEAMAEYGWPIDFTHASAVRDGQTRIPYLIRAPGVPTGHYEEIVENVDLVPTALELLGVPAPPGLELQGESLGALLRGERAQDPDQIAFSGTWAKQKQEVALRHSVGLRQPVVLDRQRVVFAARSMRWKLTVYPVVEGDLVLLHDMESDPLETTDVADRFPEVRDRLLQRSAAWIHGAEEPVEQLELTPDEIEKLRALGYVD